MLFGTTMEKINAALAARKDVVVLCDSEWQARAAAASCVKMKGVTVTPAFCLVQHGGGGSVLFVWVSTRHNRRLSEFDEVLIDLGTPINPQGDGVEEVIRLAW